MVILRNSIERSPALYEAKGKLELIHDLLVFLLGWANLTSHSKVSQQPRNNGFVSTVHSSVSYTDRSIDRKAEIMSQLAILKFVNGSLDEGFSVILQIGDSGDRISYQTLGKLPPAPKIKRYYQKWQTIYRGCGQRTRRLATSSRIEFPDGQVTNVSVENDCDRASENLRKILNSWLRIESFRPVREGILENLKR